MGRIFYIMGKSSTGKDTIYKNIIESRGMQLNPIIPYTTRPIRENERNGVEYFFTDENALDEIREQGKLIELREYHTFHGIWKYFTVNDEQINLDENDYLMIGTIESFVSMKNFFGEDIVIPILVEVEDGIRLQRALKREMMQEEPKYEELCRRFLADAIDFSEENKRLAGVEKIFKNDDLQECVVNIKNYIHMFS